MGGVHPTAGAGATADNAADLRLADAARDEHQAEAGVLEFVGDEPVALTVAHGVDGLVHDEREHGSGGVLVMMDRQAGGCLGVVAPGGPVEGELRLEEDRRDVADPENVELSTVLVEVDQVEDVEDLVEVRSDPSQSVEGAQVRLPAGGGMGPQHRSQPSQA